MTVPLPKSFVHSQVSLIFQNIISGLVRTSIFRVLIGGVCIYYVIKPIQIHLNFLSMPGMCVKTSSVSDKQKVFLNICQSQAVPPPPHLSQEALVKLLESEDPTSYRVPMSLGEPHTEVDNSERYNHIFKFASFSFYYSCP